MVEIDYEDADDDDVAMHMSFGGDAGQQNEQEDGPINMVSLNPIRCIQLSIAD